ncbi:MAG: 1-deoxy-D-xylulose-5-phosphate reductoisomerase [Lachnospiraceae bacterium]|nr:1-deoxy-D-xylulose-5-phosphate reductoisomerase [Lachnospiraceae bacterium]
MKNIAVLGSTGSIGTQTLEVVREHPDDYNIVALSCANSIDLLENQIREFKPILVSVKDEAKANDLKARIKDIDCKVSYGMEGLIELATIKESDVLVTAIVGMIGLRPTVSAIKAGKDIALANKETLVTAGHLIIPMAEEYNVSILPVDSEHSAIFQSLNGEKRENIERILLTASGGPFRGYTKEMLSKVTKAQALKHPNWAMGNKITIDSSTLVNKGLEVMEAKWLFGVSYDKVKVVVHPQSIIHSMVEYRDGAIIAELGSPDMKLPIQYALTYPDRADLDTKRLDFATLKDLTFEDPDMDTFEGLKLAYEVGNIGGSMPTVYNAANEYAVAKFLNDEIRFLDIYEYIKAAIKEHVLIDNPSVDEVIETERWVYETLNKLKL